MELSQRQKKILTVILKEYNRSARPIGSMELTRKYFPHLSSATIRNELHRLTEEGYLIQLHASSGRFPTDKTYKWWLKDLLEDEDKLSEEAEKWEKRLADFLEKRNLLFQITRLVAEICEGVSIGCSLQEEKIYKSGLKNLDLFFKQLPLKEIDKILEDIEGIDERIELIWQLIEKQELTIFIGKESPVTRSAHLSLLARFFPKPNNSFLLLIGPKNMAYQRNLAVLQALANLVSHYE